MTLPHDKTRRLVRWLSLTTWFKTSSLKPRVFLLLSILAGSVGGIWLIRDSRLPKTSPTSIALKADQATDASKELPQSQTALISAVDNLVFSEANAAWLLNYKGELLLTKDGGTSWAVIGGDVTKNFDAFTVVNGTRGLAADNEGRIWKTEDGGNIWYPVSVLTRAARDEYYMGATQVLYFPNDHGFVVDTFAVWQTKDGGFSWREVDDLSAEKLPGRVSEMSFLDATHGWAACEGNVLKTKDGGNSWRSLWEKTSLDNLTTMRTLSFRDENHGWLAATDAPKPYPENVVLYTADGGGTWHRPKGLDDRFVIYSIFFLDDKTGWAAGGSSETGLQSRLGTGVLFQTLDGGLTWQRIESAPTSDIIKTLHFTSTDEGWLASDYELYRTNDRGRTWSKVLSYPEVKDRNMRLYGVEQSADQSALENAVIRK